MSVLPKSSMKASRIRDSTTYLGKLFQWWVVLAVNNFFLNSIWNLSQCKYHSLMQSPCVYLGGKLPFSLYPPFKNRNPGMWSPWAISSPGRGDKSPSAFPQGRFLSPLITFITFFDFLQSFYIFLDLWGPELHAIIQVQPAKLLIRLGWSCLCLQQCPNGCSPRPDLPWLLQWCTVGQHLGRANRARSDVSTGCRMALVAYESIQAHFHLYTVCILSISYSTGEVKAFQIPPVNS